MLISPLANRIKPYVAGEQPQESGWIKLNTNENPYPCTAFSLPAAEKLRLYPDPDCTALKNAIAELHGVDKKNIFVGNGSDEVLGIAYQALFEANAAPVLFPDVTYSFYPVYAALYGILYRTVPLNAAFEIDPEDYCAKTSERGGIIFANPNAPTSVALSRGEVMKIVRSNSDIPVIVDEAYIDFGGESVVDEVRSAENLLVVRTLSKSYSLAGLRVGYAVGCAPLIESMERIKNCFNSYTVDCFAQCVALQAIQNQALMKSNAGKIMATRAYVSDRLLRLGWTVLPSTANFIFARPLSGNGKEIFEHLKRQKILVRRWDAPRIQEYLRISIGTDPEMERFLTAISINKSNY